MKLTARQPALNRTFEEVRVQIASRLSRETNAKRFDAFVAKLRESAKIEIVDAELDHVNAGSRAEAGEPAGAALPATPASPGTGGK